MLLFLLGKYMKLKILSIIVLSMSTFFSLNAFAYLYGAKVTIKNYTNNNLLLSFSGENNISNTPFVSKDGKNPDDMSLFSIEPNGTSTIYIDNFDWTGWLYQSKVTKFGIFKELIHAQPALLSEGTISIATGATLWNMSAYFNGEHPKVFISDYIVEATPDFQHSKFDKAGNLADLSLNIYLAEKTAKD